MPAARWKKAERTECENCTQKQNSSEVLFFTTFRKKLSPGSKTAFPMISRLGFVDSLVGVQTRQARGNARNHRENTTVENFHFPAEDN